jgi:hypothetical protein
MATRLTRRDIIRRMFGTNPTPISSHDVEKPRRSRAVVLTYVDRRRPIGKRIAALTRLYTEALGGDGALSEMKRLRIGEAAQLKALAELARGDYMRDAKGSLDDVVRIERKASHAERALGIVDKPARDQSPSLAEYLAANHGHAEAAE